MLDMRDSVDGLRRVDPGYRAPRGKIRFSKTEVLHIVAAMLVLTAAFSLVMRGSRLHPDPIINILYIAGVSLLVVAFSFLAHELGHKFVAQRYNAWSEFRSNPMGLAIALVMSFVLGFFFAAPGAVYIRGEISQKMNGIISLAGPAVNFVIAAVAIIVCLMFGGEITTIGHYIFYVLAYFNAFLGLFNMIPVPPFDGSKILAWDIRIYIIIAIIGAAEFAVVWLYL